MRVLVTGGAGYVGSTLVPRLLEQGHAVRVLDNLTHGGAPLLPVWAHPEFSFHHGDLTDAAARRRALEGVEAVVHLAAIVGDPACAREPEKARRINLEASLALLSEARAGGVRRFVFASTCSNYGRMEDPESYVHEESPLSPISLYAETKVAVEKALLEAAGNGFCPTPLRFATVFGVSPRMRFDLTVNEFTMEMVARGKLVVFGEQFWRPYIHVADAARGIAQVLAAPAERVAGRVFNVGDTAENYRKQDLVSLIKREAPGAVVEYVQKQEDPRDYRVSFTRISRELSFKVTRTVPDGIAEVARLVRDGVIRNFEDPVFRN
jgi:nucleoside-diphosphate-sugar epimerase